MPLDSPLVEALPLDVALQSPVLDDELHPLEEGGGDGGRLLPQQDVDRVRHGVAQLALGADGVLAALGILAVGEAVCWKTRGNSSMDRCRRQWLNTYWGWYKGLKVARPWVLGHVTIVTGLSIRKRMASIMGMDAPWVWAPLWVWAPPWRTLKKGQM